MHMLKDERLVTHQPTQMPTSEVGCVLAGRERERERPMVGGVAGERGSSLQHKQKLQQCCTHARPVADLFDRALPCTSWLHSTNADRSCK